MEITPERTRKLQRNIKILYFYEFFNSMLFNMTIWFFYETKFLAPEYLVLMLSLQYVVSVVLELPTGALADLIGKKKTIALGNFIMLIAWISMSIAVSPIYIIVAYFLLGIGSTFVSGADSALIYDTLKDLGEEKEYAKIISKSNIFMEIAKVIGMVIGGYAFIVWFRLPYVLYSISLFIVFIATLFYTEPFSDSEKFTWKNYYLQMKNGSKQLLKTNTIIVFSVFFLLLAGVSSYYLNFMKDAFLVAKGFNPTEMVTVFSILFVIRAVVLYLLAKYSTRDYSKLFIVFSIFTVLALIPAFWVDKTYAIILFAFGIFGFKASKIYLNQYANEFVDSKYRATALSVLNLGLSITVSLVSIISSPFIRDFGAAWFATALGVLSLVLILPLSIYLSKQIKLIQN